MRFTPKKFISMLELNDTNLTNLIKTEAQVYRSFFIPRYKEGSKRIKDLDFTYTKKISSDSVEKIFYGLVELGIVNLDDKELVDLCFKNDNFDALLPKDLL
jgi:succinate dehydrogenase flavin-adding protein (antitoxin of CptAB toxin-antitoxin module)